MKNPPKSPAENDIARMDALWLDYQRTQGRAGQELETQHPEVEPRSRLDEIYAWEDYAVNEYSKWLSDKFEPQLIESARYPS